MSTNATTGLSGPAITFSGLGSGVDTASIVSKLMQLERQPITKLQSSKTKLQAEQSIVQGVNARIQALRDRAADLLSSGAFGLRAASTTAATVATATASAGAARGSFDVNVTALAKAHTMASGGTDTALGATGLPADGDTLTVTVGTTTKTVTFSGADTLQKVVEQINAQAGEVVGASAVTVRDGTGTAHEKLMLVSDTTGAGGTMTVGGTAAGGFALADTQAGADAQLTVNSVPVSAAGNTVADAVSGVTLALTGVGATTITVGTDGTGIQQKVQAFVDAYNAVVDEVGSRTKYDAATKTAGALQGETWLTGFMGQMRTLAGSAVGSLQAASEKYDSLAQIGITSDRGGRLTLDATKFQAALTADPGRVADVFAKEDALAPKDLQDGVAVRIKDLANAFSTDVIAKRLTGYTDRLSRMDKKIADLEQVMVLRESRLKQQFAAMEKAVAQFQTQGQWLSQQLG
ncbi:MAG: flagellar filament capping protein FliD [Thermoleophilia bacterium]|nr:flagellar filament capping protein FliD [Thermoleophilia bacterium]